MPPVPEIDNFAIHGQTTYLNQYVFPFRNPYSGRNSLDPNQGRETWDVTGYLGMQLWQGAELWVYPAIDHGFGLTSTLGVAGFTSGEAHKVGASVPYPRLHHACIPQAIDLRLDTGTFDYAADPWGYTYGASAEWYQGDWTLRGGMFDLSIIPNDIQLDPHFGQFQWVGEIERRYQLWGQPGKVAVTGFLTRGRMGSFDDAVRQANLLAQPADIATVRRYRGRAGLAFNLEQQLVENVGFFPRAGVSSGNVEPY